MSRWPILLLVLLASVFGLVACGDDASDEDPTEVLEQTFGEGKDVKSGRLDASVKIDVKGIEQLKDPVTIALRGPFQSAGGNQLPKFDFELDINSGGQSFSAGAVSTTEKGYLRFQGTDYAVPEALFKQFRDGYAETAKCNEEKGSSSNSTFRALGIDPRRWLKDPSNEGTEDVGGAETIHISSSVDVPKFLEDVNRVLGRTDLQQNDPCAKDKKSTDPTRPTGRQLTKEQQKRITEAVKDARVDVWTGAEDKIMRRVNVQLGFDATKGRSGKVGLDLTIGGINDEQKIEEPKDAKPLEELVAQFGGQLPGTGSGQPQNGGSGSGSGGAQAPQSGGENSRYAQCVNEAAGDLKKLQECAQFLGQ